MTVLLPDRVPSEIDAWLFDSSRETSPPNHYGAQFAPEAPAPLLPGMSMHEIELFSLRIDGLWLFDNLVLLSVDNHVNSSNTLNKEWHVAVKLRYPIERVNWYLHKASCIPSELISNIVRNVIAPILEMSILMWFEMRADPLQSSLRRVVNPGIMDVLHDVIEIGDWARKQWHAIVLTNRKSQKTLDDTQTIRNYVRYLG